MNTDVLIVGAGPTGLALAAQLIRFGVDFHIVDKKETTTPYSKAIGVQARTLEIYEQIGIADDLVSRGWIANKVKLLEGGEVRGQIDLSQIGEGMSPYPFLLIAEQGRHEALVYDRIRSMGKDVSWETELENFTHDETGVHARVRSASGETEEIGAKFLVGCDGAHSLVRHKLGIEFTGSTFERLFYVADVEIDWAFEHDALHANLGKDTLTAFFPMPGDRRWRIVGTFPEGHEKEEGEILYDEIERQIIADTDLKFDITTVHWFSTYKVHSRHVGKFSSGRCHLAGDSAHIHTPAGAQGMNTGIQDSYNLAWKLAAVLKNGAPLSLLDTYN
jgi:2-polyprenyl-6-methoxyphenol hydroxylase-like FAD-dependent oxidoreductase